MRERGLENDLEQKLEDMADKVGFEKLLEFAGDICLRSPVEQFSPTIEYSESKAIIEQLGIRGLRAAIEVDLGVEFDIEEYAVTPEIQEAMQAATPEVQDKIQAELQLKSDFKIKAISPVLYPNAYSGKFSYENAARIEAFGKTLIGEAYDVLGADADEYLEKFRQATNDEEQIEALDWLSTRIYTIAHGDYEIMENDGDAFDYHPARLSPKLMGRYPDTTLPPTCLGMSLIAAGFLDKAGAQYMHAGVMASRRQYELIAATTFFIKMPEIAEEKFACPAPDNIQSALKQQAVKAISQSHEDNGYHAATYAKLKSGSWYQLDPNFRSSSQIFFPTMDATLDQTHEQLNDMHSLAPGMELAANMHLYGSIDSALSYIERVKLEKVPTVNDIEEFLDQYAQADTLADDVFERFIVPFFTDESEDILTILFNQSIHEDVDDAEHEGMKMTVLRQHYQTMFTKYVCGERTPEEFVQSLGDYDKHQEAISALRFLPFLITANWVNDLINSNVQDVYEHQELEFGLPHHRIGATVLSDIASHYDFGLSPKFWLSNWNSLVPVTESLRLDANTRMQQVLNFNNMRHTDKRRLTYRKSLRIIKSSLSSDERYQP